MSEYTVNIIHDDDGELEIRVQDVGHSADDRAAIAWALREAAKLVESGLVIDREALQ